MVNGRKTVLLVDDNPTNLSAGKNMLKEQYKVYPVPSAEIMFDLLESVDADLILLDIEMPDMNGYDAIRKLKATERWRQIPVIFLTAMTGEGSELEGLSLGGIDYVTKPFSAPLLLKRIENHLELVVQRRQLQDFNDRLGTMVKSKTEQVLALQDAVLGTVANLVEFRDDVTGGHVERTSRYLEILVNAMLEDGLYAAETEGWDMNYLIQSAKLHDVGKIGISDLILNKPGKLTDEEFEIMKQHPKIGVTAIRQIEQNAPDHSFLRHAGRIAGYHHEKWDGTGYPYGFKGTDIPLEGRLMAISDVYDALISARPYKKPFSTEEAKAIILEGRGTHFDPALVDVFLRVADQFAQVVQESAFAV
ncbi:MAG: response regulator [Clostridiales Family XIII bacterium]|jgi:putative two-component system response regulator|nr:response regulator [Clostridiales Family XIII bacterium]